MTPDGSSKLIFDLGMHRGLDTDFYLKKGFNVIALEANPLLCQNARARFRDAIATGRLVVVESALTDEDESTTSFYVNSVKDDWSSTSRKWAEKGGHVASEIEVPTITLGRMFERFGIPYYIKCDVEGADSIFVQQLKESGVSPEYVSVEAIDERFVFDFHEVGYRKFAIMNQTFNRFLKPPFPALEGEYVDVEFNGFMSGLFGREIPQTKWTDFEECVSRYGMFETLKRKDDQLILGWLDFHASK